jgi:hypothetical protein
MFHNNSGVGAPAGLKQILSEDLVLVPEVLAKSRRENSEPTLGLPMIKSPQRNFKESID